jgi:hypothetical protein
MADTFTQDGFVAGRYKSFAIHRDTDTLFSHDPVISGFTLYGSKYGRPFSPNRLTISYTNGTQVKVYNITGSYRTWGSVTYADYTTLPANTDQFGYRKHVKKLTDMPAWLSTLVTSNI